MGKHTYGFPTATDKAEAIASALKQAEADGFITGPDACSREVLETDAHRANGEFVVAHTLTRWRARLKARSVARQLAQQVGNPHTQHEYPHDHGGDTTTTLELVDARLRWGTSDPQVRDSVHALQSRTTKPHGPGLHRKYRHPRTMGGGVVRKGDPPIPIRSQQSPTGSRRTVALPPDWHIVRPAVLKRDGYQCTWLDLGVRCHNRATDVDHIGDPADHGMDNLRALCGPHHDSRTGRQAAHARWTRQRQQAARIKPKHPGML